MLHLGAILKWDWMGLDGSPGGVKYGAPSVVIIIHDKLPQKFFVKVRLVEEDSPIKHNHFSQPWNWTD